MKVHNKSIAGASAHGIESTKSARTGSASRLKNKSGHHVGANEMRDSSKVDVSDRAQMMKRAKELAGGQSIDEAKVARLQKLIDEGKYKMDADKIADRLMDEHLRMPDSE